MESQKTSIWNAIHTAEILSTGDTGLQLKIGEVIALLPKEELMFLTAPLGENIQVYLENPKQPTASIYKAQELSEIDAVSIAMQKNEAVPGMVIGAIKGGFSVSLLAKTREEAEQGHGLRAFLPFSHVGLDTKMLPELNDREAYFFKVKDFKPEEGNIIVSRRSILQKERRENEKLFWDKHQVGDIVSGVVKSLVPYGAFVELDGADALLHASDMSFEHHPV
ncbi:MAG: S1 RNA-binding domain-containing protein, partial [Myxococcaceae bacterium]